MQPGRSETGPKWQYGDRGASHRDDHGGRHPQREPHHKYGDDGHGGAERTGRGREYGDSPQRFYAKDSASRDWNRRSPVRRRLSSPDWSLSDQKKRRFAGDSKDDYRYRPEPDDKAYGKPPDGPPCGHLPKDFKHKLPHEDDFKHRKPAPDSRGRHRHEDFTYRHPAGDDAAAWRSSGYYKERDGRGRSRGHSEEGRTPSRDWSPKCYGKQRERNDSPPAGHQDHRQSHSRLALNGSRRQSFEHDNQSPAPPERTKPTKGFQRFLDVLNKGVNVDMLTKIVTRVGDQSDSPASSQNALDRPWSPGCAEGQWEGQPNSQQWRGSEGFYGQASPQHRRGSFSPKRSSMSDGKPCDDGGRSCLSPTSRSPSVAEKASMTPEEEHKHRQMQDVLQAIGVDLGFEELGQMSHRIQERLYGKKDGDCGRRRKGSQETATKPAFSPRRKSRSASSASSSGSSSSPPAQDCSPGKDSSIAQSDKTETNPAEEYRAVEYGGGGGASLLDSRQYEGHQSAAMFQPFSSTATNNVSESPTTPMMPAFPPVNYPPPLYPPPNLLHAGPRPPILPQPPPFLPYPCLPPLNMAAAAPHVFPPHMPHPPPPYFNLLNVNPFQPPGAAQKSQKAPSRPRCLQVIETKQPG